MELCGKYRKINILLQWLSIGLKIPVLTADDSCMQEKD